MDNEPIVFDDWERVLKAEIPPDIQRAYREAIIKFHYHPMEYWNDGTME